MKGVTGRTLVFGLVGHPVRHSLSPEIHNRLFRSLGVDAVYVAFDVLPQKASGVADALRVLDIRGVNLTVPFKGDIVNHLDRVTRAAEEATAVNVVIHQEGELTGYNTDGEGFCRGFEEAFGATLAGRRVLLLGAGGAARAVAAAVADRGGRSVTIMNRTLSTAENAVSQLGRYFPMCGFDAQPLTTEEFAEQAPVIDLVVNCTAGGAAELVAQMPVERLPPRATWIDINYWMADPPCFDACKSRGIVVQDGLPMLVHQGALSFELFTGLPVDPAHIRANLG